MNWFHWYLVLVLAVTCMLSGMDEEHRFWRFVVMYVLAFFGIPVIAFIAFIGFLALLAGAGAPPIPSRSRVRQSDYGEAV